ncbi:MAG: IPT/TIG domain-containing protein [Deltaproteobacteria bacterium]|nr:IPT/TIG domain-containing protein [Deltaproteobacteria bacterium]
MRLLAVLACVVLSGCVLSGSTKKQCQDGVVAGTSCAIDEDAHDDMTGATGVIDMTGATGVTETTGTTGETGETGSTASTGTETPPAPTITRIAPSLQGTDGSLVVIGTHLLAATVVTVGGGPAATIVSHTDTCMTIIVPVGSASGSVSVTSLGRAR